MFPNINSTKPTTKNQNPILPAIGRIPINARNPITASMTAIQKVTTLGALSFMAKSPLSLKINSPGSSDSQNNYSIFRI